MSKVRLNVKKKNETHGYRMYIINQQINSITLHLRTYPTLLLPLLHQLMIKLNKQQYLVLNICE